MLHVPNSFDNPQFRKELGEMFDDKIAPIVHVQQQQAKLLGQHDRYIQRSKGAMSILGGLWLLLCGAFEAHVKRWI